MVTDNGSTAAVIVVDGDIEVATWFLGGAGRPDLSVVDDLARLQLAAQRVGLSVRIHDPLGRIRELLELAGLGDVVPDAAGLALEPGGEPEGGEELGVDEVVEPGDPGP